MPKTITAAVALLLVATAAFAQSGSAYNPKTGGTYNWYSSAAGTHVYGTDPATRRAWQSTFRSNGNQYGIDANGNYWTYNAGSGSYVNSNGHGCLGTGSLRSCW